MQDPKKSHTRKRWYERAIEATTLWKTLLSKPIDIPSIKPFSLSLWKSIPSKPTQVVLNHPMSTTTATTSNSSSKLRKCSSTRRVASSLTHSCLCAPISSSYTEIFHTAGTAPPKRSFSYGRSRSLPSSSTGISRTRVEGGRRVFRGESLRGDVLMRRFVVEEEAMMMRVRRRGDHEMEVIRRRSGVHLRRNNIGPSPLSRMVLATSTSSIMEF